MSKKRSAKKNRSTKKTCLSEICKAISECSSGSNLTLDVRFGFLQVGSLCNASESNAFTKARCHMTNITNKRNGHYYLEFKELFGPGKKLLEDYKKNPKSRKSLNKTIAIGKLESFLREKGMINV